jgi:phosphatidylinositol glycan class B
LRALLGNRLYLIYACLAVGIAGITSYTNFGHLCGDEYSQIFEFAAWKLGYVGHEDLRLWEFDSQMRPSVQIWAVVEVYRLLGLISGEVNPFAVNYLIYFFSALLAIVSILVFTGAFIQRVTPKYRDHFVILSLFSWLVLYTNPHFNSENLCGHFLLLGTGLLYARIDNPSWRRLLVAGLFLGLSFCCRFQAGFAILGLMAWFFITAWKRSQMASWVLLMASLLLTVAFFNVMLDHWFYGHWVFSPYNYYVQNIATGTMNRASGTSPWFAYLFLVAMYAPFGPAYVVAFFHQVIRQRFDILTWIITPFVLFHVLIGHKEVRFLLPMLGFMPVLIMVALEDYRTRYRFLDSHLETIIKITWIVNLVMCISLLIPTATEIGGWRYLHDHYKKPTILYFQPSVHQKLLYYKSPNLQVVDWKSGEPTPCPPGHNVVIAFGNKSKEPKSAFPLVYTFFPFGLNSILPAAILHSIGYFDLYELQNVEPDGHQQGASPTPRSAP